MNVTDMDLLGGRWKPEGREFQMADNPGAQPLVEDEEEEFFDSEEEMAVMEEEEIRAFFPSPIESKSSRSHLPLMVRTKIQRGEKGLGGSRSGQMTMLRMSSTFLMTKKRKKTKKKNKIMK